MNLELKNTLPIDAETGKRYLPTWDEYWNVLSTEVEWTSQLTTFNRFKQLMIDTPLSIGQFIPVGDEGEPLGKLLTGGLNVPRCGCMGDCGLPCEDRDNYESYLQAEDRVIFEGIHEREYRNESDTSGWLGIGTDELEVFTWGPFGYECNFKNLHSLAYEMGKFNQKLIVR